MNESPDTNANTIKATADVTSAFPAAHNLVRPAFEQVLQVRAHAHPGALPHRQFQPGGLYPSVLLVRPAIVIAAQNPLGANVANEDVRP